MSQINNITLKFNNSLNIFISYLREINSKDKDLKNLQTIVNGLIKTNYKSCIEQFILNILEYGDKIIEHDYLYFHNLDLKFDNDKNKYLMKLLKFKKYANNLNDEQKTTIFDFLELLVYQSREYLKLKYN